MAEDAGHDPPGRRVEEQREVEEGEEDRPAGGEEQVPRAVAHVDGEVVMAQVEPAHEPRRDGELDDAEEDDEAEDDCSSARDAVSSLRSTLFDAGGTYRDVRGGCGCRC